MAVDLLMMFTKNGNPVPAEGLSNIDTKDRLMAGFAPGGFFELDDFDFGISLSDSDSGSRREANETEEQRKQREHRESSKGGKFSKWVTGTSLSAGPGQSTSIYPVTMDEFSFQRQLDKSSISLFYSCFRTRSFDSATLVKRKHHNATPFFRIDFNAVLITDIGWSGGDVIKEKVKFVCRKVSVQYRPQNNDGTPGDTVGGDWLSLMKTG